MTLGTKGFQSCGGGHPAPTRRLRGRPDRERVVVIGRSPILGKPVGMLLLARDATVTYVGGRS
jgi:methylenetetrahydrofolate dehydrogenase (NADP+)/methenyltetrahydrofolate cyclohydrolase